MAKTAMKAETPGELLIPKLEIKIMPLKLIGDSPLIMHKWSEKAIREIEDKQQKKAKQGKTKRDPETEFRESMYEHPGGGYCFPAVAFKAAAVDACTQLSGITKVFARGAFHINEAMVKIESDPPIMRTDMVRIGMGTSDVRYRGEFQNWSAEFEIRYNVSALSPEQITNMFNVAGFAVGIGEWRPQKDGSFGMFHVDV